MKLIQIKRFSLYKKYIFLVVLLLFCDVNVYADQPATKVITNARETPPAVPVPYSILLKSRYKTSNVFKVFQIHDGNDDVAEIRANGTMLMDDWSLQLGYNPTRSEEQIVGLRFDNVDIPRKAIIRSAYLRFYTNNSNSTGPVNFTISGEASDNSLPFSSLSYTLSSRPKTTARAAWSPLAWEEPWVSKELHKSTDIGNIINEIVSRQGYETGNAISLFIEGSGTNMRSFYSYDYSLLYPDRIRFARLIIEYQRPQQSCALFPSILRETSPEFIPDFSYAGYKWGLATLPDLYAAHPDITYVDVTSYGAVADDQQDDTQAIRDAVAAHKNTAGTVLLHFPAGRFIVSDVIVIERSNFVLQGEGSTIDGTIFQIDTPMSALAIDTIDPSARAEAQYDKYRDVITILNEYENGVWPTTDGEPYSLFSWTGGFFYTRYDGNRYARQTIAGVVAGAKRGDREFTIENSAVSLQAGDVVRFEWANPVNNSFLHYLVGADPVTIGSQIIGQSSGLVAQPVTVVGVDGERITIREPLLHDVGPGWTARIRTVYFNENVGFENFSIEFPMAAEFGGHHLEKGYNGMYLTDLQQSWVRNVSVHNSDSAIIMDHCKNNTLTGITTTGKEGHYTIYIGRSYGILAKKFDFQSPALHNPSFNSESVMNVYSNGRIHTAKFDQHNGLNHQNLFDNISVRYTANLFSHGGSDNVLPTSAMYNTFWNIEVQELAYNNLLGTCNDAPGARLIGLHSPGNTLTVDYSPGPYIEGLDDCLAVPSLYEYQLQKRQERK